LPSINKGRQIKQEKQWGKKVDRRRKNIRTLHFRDFILNNYINLFRNTKLTFSQSLNIHRIIFTVFLNIRETKESERNEGMGWGGGGGNL